MKVFIKGLNICAPRRQNLLHYRCFLERSGHEVVLDPHKSDVILVWTCGFRKDVIENSIVELNHCLSEYPGSVIALGCLPDIDRKELEERFKGAIVPWKEEDKFFEEYFQAEAGSFAASSPVFCEGEICSDASEHRKRHPESDVIFADQFIKLLINQGCPFECTYCTEKLAFPPFKSTNEDALALGCRLQTRDHKQSQVMLIGDCIGEYGRDTDSSLPRLIRRLRSESANTIFALQNFHPKNFLDYYEDMKQFLEDGWIAHLNIPVQSASDRVLSIMRRPYLKKDIDRIFGLFLSMNFKKFDTHIIVGFPGETEDEFMETIDFLRRYKPTYALVSKYYDPPTAPSFKLNNKVSEEAINKRIVIIEEEMKKSGIIYNIDGAGFMQERLERINKKIKCV